MGGRGRRFACQPVCTPEHQQTYHHVLATASTSVNTLIEGFHSGLKRTSHLLSEVASNTQAPSTSPTPSGWLIVLYMHILCKDTVCLHKISQPFGFCNNWLPVRNVLSDLKTKWRSNATLSTPSPFLSFSLPLFLSSLFPDSSSFLSYLHSVSSLGL